MAASPANVQGSVGCGMEAVQYRIGTSGNVEIVHFYSLAIRYRHGRDLLPRRRAGGIIFFANEF